MTEKIVPAHGSSVARVDIPADCKWRVSDIYIDETAWKEGKKTEPDHGCDSPGSDCLPDCRHCGSPPE